MLCGLQILSRVDSGSMAPSNRRGSEARWGRQRLAWSKYVVMASKRLYSPIPHPASRVRLQSDTLIEDEIVALE